jgi:hypothetical protein
MRYASPMLLLSWPRSAGPDISFGHSNAVTSIGPIVASGDV